MLWFRVLAAVACALVGSAAYAGTLELYGRLPSIQAVRVSPDGSGLAMIVSNGERRRVVVQDLSTGKGRTVSAGAIKVRNIAWAGPNHLIITASVTTVPLNIIGPRREWAEAYDLNVAAGRLQPMLGHVEAAMNAVFGAPAVRTIQGKTVVFLNGWSFGGSRGQYTVFRVDLDPMFSRISEVGGAYADDLLLGSDGRAVAQASYEGVNGRWLLKIKRGPEWIESRALKIPNEHPQIVGFGRDGQSALVAELQDNQAVYREVSLTTGAWSEPLEMPGATQPLFDPEKQNLIGYFGLVGDEYRYVFFDPKDQKIWAAITALYRGQLVRLESWSADRSRIVVLVDSPTEGPAYALVDLGKHTATWLGGLYDNLTPEDVAPAHAVRFKAHDGLELTGYLTSPRGVTAKGLPLVVLPHGGPATRDVPGFDWWAQALASRGYAVLQVNYRGSGGFGWPFLSAGFGQWGRKMQTDLSDGVRYLADQGVIDPSRVCIVGASYGGYAALAGATLDRGVYRCAVSYAGLSDLPQIVEWEGSAVGRRYWLRFMGGESRNDKALIAISPARNADKAQVPILIMHGRDDTVVPLEQSRMMVSALRSAGKPVEFVMFDGTDHWLSNGETRLAMLKATVAFLEKNNPPN